MIQTLKAFGYRSLSEKGYKCKTILFLVEEDKVPLFVIRRLFLVPEDKEIKGCHLLKKTERYSLHAQEMVFLAQSMANIKDFLSNIKFVYE